MAMYGATMLLLDAEGFGVRTEWLTGSPFADHRVPAVGLALGVGGSAVLATLAMARAEATLADLVAIGAGLVLMGFEVVETYWFGLRNLKQPVMFAVGLVVAGTALYLWRIDIAGKWGKTI
jgi:hypothetical protein